MQQGLEEGRVVVILYFRITGSRTQPKQPTKNEHNPMQLNKK
jgi:hypothetical protein